MVLFQIPPDAFEHMGLAVSGFADRSKNTKLNTQRFRSFYGVGASALAAAFVDIQTTDIPDGRINCPDPIFFLMAVEWLRTYKVEIEFAGKYKIDEDTVRKYLWMYATAISLLKDKKIVWLWDNPDVPDGKVLNEVNIVSVDGVHCNICEPRTDPSSGWYSFKYNKPGLAYEIAIAIFHNQVVWINGPFKAGENDLIIFKKPGGLGEKIPEGKRACADRIYTPDKRCSTRNKLDTPQVKKIKRRIGAQHESFNARIKTFKILKDQFRHGHEKHHIAFEAVVVLAQYDMENGNPLFDV